MNPRAELHQSAPSASTRAMSKPVMIRPAAPSRIVSRSPAPTRQLWANTSPSRKGVPMWSTNSSGAAPVPPSVPSMTMKSGRMPVSSIALQMPMNSHGWPMQSLKPTGLPPDSSRSLATKCTISSGVENAECDAGETQSTPAGTPRASEISVVTFGAWHARRRRGWGLAPCDSLISIIFTCGSAACAAKRSAQNVPSSLRQPEIARSRSPR